MDKVIPIGKLAVEISKNSENELMQADGFDILGAMYEHYKMNDSAYYAYLKMLSISLKLNNNRLIYWSYYHLGINHSGMGNIDSALYYFRKQYDYDILYKGSSGTYPMLHEIAKVYQYTGNVDSAMVYFDNMILFSQQQNDPGLELDAYMAGIYFYGKINDTEKKVKFLNKAIAIAEEIHDEKAQIKIYIQIADMFFRQNENYIVALEYYQKALDLLLPQDTLLKASILNEIGVLHLEYGKDSLALVSTQQALKYAEEVGYKDEISKSYLNLGKIYYYRGELMKAIENFKISLKIGCDFCQKIAFHNTVISIADLYSELNQPDKALEYYLEAYKLAEEEGIYREMAISNLNLGNYYKLSKPSLAGKYYSTSYGYAEKGDDIYVLKAVCDKLSIFYETRQDYKKAYMYINRSVELNDSIHKMNRQASLANWELKFEMENINRANELSVEEIKRQKTFRNFLLIITLLLIGFGFFIYMSYQRKKNDNKILTRQKRQIEEQNLEIQAQVEEITSQKEEIERISHELHEADAAKLRFFTNLSHEFRTPLTLILNPAKNLLDNLPVDEEYKKQMEYIYANAQKLYDLTNQIMELQKLEAGKLQLTIVNEDIIGYCLGIVASFESLCDSKKVSVHIDSDTTKAIVGFDKDKTGKILTNLLSNAIKFSSEDSVIQVKISLSESRLILSISDEGVGIPANEVSGVFKRYKQASNNKNVGGTGIGLAYVYELVTFMKGKVSIESEENVGTEVTIEIPVQVIHIENQQALKLEIVNPNKAQTARSFNIEDYTTDKTDKPIILIVEDNDQLREYIAQLFQFEHSVVLAPDGHKGIEMALKHTPDLIISDVVMPNMDGFEFCTAIKNDEHTSHIPLLLLTAKDSEHSSLEGYHSGADDYILKPFDNEILKLKVRNILNTRAALGRQYNSEQNILPDISVYSDIDKNFMKKCIEAIEKNISNSQFSVDILASELGFSRSNLYRKAISLTTFNPAELIRNIRMQHAARLLKTTPIRVNEVAIEVGYDSTSKFSQAFKKHHGVLPSQIQ
jgi:signal transduction histidine kinase/DNA-binding response OmpR family regulator